MASSLWIRRVTCHGVDHGGRHCRAAGYAAPDRCPYRRSEPRPASTGHGRDRAPRSPPCDEARQLSSRHRRTPARTGTSGSRHAHSVECSPSPVRDSIKDQRIVVNVVIPPVSRSRHSPIVPLARPAPVSAQMAVRTCAMRSVHIIEHALMSERIDGWAGGHPGTLTPRAAPASSAGRPRDPAGPVAPWPARRYITGRPVVGLIGERADSRPDCQLRGRSGRRISVVDAW